MGIPLLRMAAQMTGGDLSIQSAPGVGTTTTAVFHTDAIDCPPVGDLAGSLSLFLQGAPDTLETRYLHETDAGSFELDTREIRAILGEGISLSEPDVALWLRDYISENEAALIS